MQSAPPVAGCDELEVTVPAIHYTYRDCFKLKTGYEWRVEMVMHGGRCLTASVLYAGHAVYQVTYHPQGGLRDHEQTREWLIEYAARLLATAKSIVATSCEVPP